MRILTGIVCAAMLLSVPAVGAAQEQEYDPQVDALLTELEMQMLEDGYDLEIAVDSATWEDHDLMEELLLSLPDGEAPRNVRKLVAGVVAEFRLALNARMKGDVLTLDDGSQVVVEKAKKKRAKKKGKKRVHGAFITWDGPGQPSSITIRSGHCLRILTFPTGSGAPNITSICVS